MYRFSVLYSGETGFIASNIADIQIVQIYELDIICIQEA